MRPVGSNRLDSTVQHLGEEGLPEEFSKRPEAISGREGPAMPGDEDFSEGANGVMEVEYDHGDGDISRPAEVSVGCFCCSKLSPTSIVYMSAFVSSLTSVLLGYDVGVISGAIKFIVIDFDLSVLQEGVIVSSLNLVAAAGALIAGTVSDTLGRKRSIAMACVVFIMGSILKICAQSFGVLLVGRIVTGIGVGSGFVVAPVYIAEITPPHVRGRLTSLTDISINLGIVIGYLVAFICTETISNDSGKWRTMLGISIVPPFIILASLCVLPESPRYLIGRRREQEALAVLYTIVDSPEGAKAELKEIKKVVGEESDAKATWHELLCNTSPAVRGTLMLGIGLGIAQQASGSEAAVYYSPSILEDAGLTSNAEQLSGNILVGVFKLLGEVFAFFLVDRTGRRPLLLTSSSLVTFFLIVLAIAFANGAPPGITLTGLCFFMWSFSLGMGALTFLIAAEIFPLRHRGRGVSLTVCVNRITSGLVALVFPVLEKAITASGIFIVFTIASISTVWFYKAKVPETMDKTLEEISARASAESRGERRGQLDTPSTLGLAPSVQDSVAL